MGKSGLALAVVIGLTSIAHAQPGPSAPDGEQQPPPPPLPTPFDRGKFGLGLGASEQAAFGENYLVVGGGVTYYVLNGVELGLSALHEFGSGPSISRVSPSLRYVAQPLVHKWPVVPYIGAFYAHDFIGGGYVDQDSIGGRAGFIMVSGHAVLGLGLAVEHFVAGCTMDCTIEYPDITVSLAL
jgi:hypothetical protein